MSRVNLFIIGAMRAGSTTLCNVLSQHPQIFIPVIKEPDFFVAELCRRRMQDNSLSLVEKNRCRTIISGGEFRTASSYNSLFVESGNAEYIGEGSHYFHHPDTAKLIFEYNPDARILISLRNPIERIYSEYLLRARDGNTRESFSVFVHNRVKKNADGHWGMKSGVRLEKGCYASLLKPWLDHFGVERVKIVYFEELAKQLSHVIRDIYMWLGVDAGFAPHLVRAQRGGVPRSRLLMNVVNHKGLFRPLLKKMVPPALKWKLRDMIYSKLLVKEQIDGETRMILREIYAPHILELQALLGRDLSSWE